MKIRKIKIIAKINKYSNDRHLPDDEKTEIKKGTYQIITNRKVELRKNPILNRNASINGEEHCFVCGFPVVLCLVNDSFNKNYEHAKEYDYFAYCSNKSCKNHSGEGYLDSYPNWVLYPENAPHLYVELLESRQNSD